MKLLKNQDGMSLIGVLAAAAALGVVSMGLLTVGKNMFEIQTRADVKADVQNQVYFLQAGLASVADCSLNLQGYQVTNDLVELSGARKQLRYVSSADPKKFSDSAILPAQGNIPGSKIQVSRIGLKAVPDSTRVAVLVVEFQSKQELLGGALAAKEIPLQVELDAARRIVRCTASTQTLNPEPLSEDPSKDDDSARSQGAGCTGPAPSRPKSEGGVTVTADDVTAAIGDICSSQPSYPIKKGLVIAKDKYNNCLKRVYPDFGSDGDSFKKCRGLLEVASTELSQGLNSTTAIDVTGNDVGQANYFVSPSPVDNDILLRNRTGYANVEECKKQKAFSDGDIVIGAVAAKQTLRRCTTSMGGSAGGSNQTRCEPTQTMVFETQFVCINNRWVRTM